MNISILRLPDVIKRTGLSRSSIYQKISDGDFPRPISLSSRAVGWIEFEIDDWLEQRISSSRNPHSEQSASPHHSHPDE